MTAISCRNERPRELLSLCAGCQTCLERQERTPSTVCRSAPVAPDVREAAGTNVHLSFCRSAPVAHVRRAPGTRTYRLSLCTGYQTCVKRQERRCTWGSIALRPLHNAQGGRNERSRTLSARKGCRLVADSPPHPVKPGGTANHLAGSLPGRRPGPKRDTSPVLAS
jgi:hypothetical protein